VIFDDLTAVAQEHDGFVAMRQEGELYAPVIGAFLAYDDDAVSLQLGEDVYLIRRPDFDAAIERAAG
jgi:hypothetical protein